MIFRTVLSLLALLPACLLAEFVPPTGLKTKAQPKSAGPESNGAVEKMATAMVQSTILPDVGFYQVPFGIQDTDIPVKFVFTNKVVQILTITDCFWNKDAFQIKDFGHVIGLQTLGCTDTTGCDAFRADPYGCWTLTDVFCSVSAVILPGTHSITFTVQKSPQDGGSAFVRLDTACSSSSGIVPCCTLDTVDRVCNISIFHGPDY